MSHKLSYLVRDICLLSKDGYTSPPILTRTELSNVFCTDNGVVARIK